MGPLELVHLSPLMERTDGRADIRVAVIDRPAVATLPELAGARIFELAGGTGSECARVDSAARRHGTFIAGILCAQRGSTAPAICPNCTLLVRSVFPETTGTEGVLPSATAEGLAAAIVDTVQAGARAVNMSAVLARSSIRGRAHRGGSSRLCSSSRRARRRGHRQSRQHQQFCNHSSSLVHFCHRLRRRRRADTRGKPRKVDRQAVPPHACQGGHQSRGRRQSRILRLHQRAPFVTGTIALLLSEFPNASAAHFHCERIGRPRRHLRIQGVLSPSDP
jgi:hypothetical protein